MRALVTGWFSFLHGEATAGDLLAKDVACRWLRSAGMEFDVALSPVFGAGVDVEQADPAAYSHLLFVCGPAKGAQVDWLVRRFARCRLVGLNVSIVDAAHGGGPFDLLLERDSDAVARPDLSIVAATSRVPVVGVVRAHPQPEYGAGLHDQAHRAIDRLLASRPLSIVECDTRVDPRQPGQRSTAEVESLLARLDVVVTTRLHGMVLALRNGVPAVAVDPIAGGAKVRRQADVLDWPVAFVADALDPRALGDALAFCLTPEARREADACRRRAIALLERLERDFQARLRQRGTPSAPRQG
ncbi:MAG TPA: polysaccharide pyruvyl transferase family protein [Egibacteraceae bacterium]|nr:polysaccharide pyruvyl transferase family protein [Actinomycetota bacterium]HWB72482.1 polysaccharide pyruvyl transferase family protein [Egibacteraceae bacterium]